MINKKLSIHESLLKKPDNFRSIIESYAFQLTHIPVPPATCQRFSLVLVIFKIIIIKIK